MNMEDFVSRLDRLVNATDTCLHDDTPRNRFELAHAGRSFCLTLEQQYSITSEEPRKGWKAKPLEWPGWNQFTSVLMQRYGCTTDADCYSALYALIVELGKFCDLDHDHDPVEMQMLIRWFALLRALQEKITHPHGTRAPGFLTLVAA